METNRAIAYFTHRGEDYKIHERTNPLHDGTPCTRRFIVRRSDDRWSGEASTVREARRVLDARLAAEPASVRLKTYVRYLPEDREIVLHCGRKRQRVKAGSAVFWGLGDNTVLEDGFTVPASADQFARIRNTL